MSMYTLAHHCAAAECDLPVMDASFSFRTPGWVGNKARRGLAAELADIAISSSYVVLARLTTVREDASASGRLLGGICSGSSAVGSPGSRPKNLPA